MLDNPKLFIAAMFHHWGVLVVGVLLFFCGAIKRVRGRRTSAGFLFFFAAFCVVLGGYFAWQDEHKALVAEQSILNGEYVEEHRPYLNPVLVIDSIIDKMVAGRLEIENKGKLPALGIHEKVVSDKEILSVSSVGSNRALEPQLKMDVPLPPGLHAESNGLHFNVILDYSSRILGSNFTYKSSFRFGVPLYAVAVGRFNLGKSDASYAGTEISDLADTLKSLDVASGKLTMTLNARSSAPVSWFDTSLRSLRFDFANKEVVFKSMTATGRMIELIRGIMDNESGDHSVLLMWDTNAAMLEVDGDKTSDPADYSKSVQ